MAPTVYEDYHELLDRKDIDVVHVLTPNREHSQITVDARSMPANT